MDFKESQTIALMLFIFIISHAKKPSPSDNQMLNEDCNLLCESFPSSKVAKLGEFIGAHFGVCNACVCIGASRSYDTLAPRIPLRSDSITRSRFCTIKCKHQESKFTIGIYHWSLSDNKAYCMCYTSDDEPEHIIKYIHIGMLSIIDADGNCATHCTESASDGGLIGYQQIMKFGRCDCYKLDKGIPVDYNPEEFKLQGKYPKSVPTSTTKYLFPKNLLEYCKTFCKIKKSKSGVYDPNCVGCMCFISNQNVTSTNLAERQRISMCETDDNCLLICYPFSKIEMTKSELCTSLCRTKFQSLIGVSYKTSCLCYEKDEAVLKTALKDPADTPLKREAQCEIQCMVDYPENGVELLTYSYDYNKCDCFKVRKNAFWKFVKMR